MTEKAQGGCKQLDIISEGGAEELKGDSRGEVKELDETLAEKEGGWAGPSTKKDNWSCAEPMAMK